MPRIVIAGPAATFTPSSVCTGLGFQLTAPRTTTLSKTSGAPAGAHRPAAKA
ncbi:hypothetical protein [Streptomyces mirabilis]